MEFDTPWAPTPPSERLAAVRAYVEGEALCDAGDYAAGTLRLRAAGRLAWELEREVWPSWATSLRAALLDGAAAPSAAPPPPPLIDRFTAAWQPELAPWLGSSRDASAAAPPPRWWRDPEAAAAIGRCLSARNAALVDAFAGREVLERARAECLAASEEGTLRPARVRTASRTLAPGAPMRRGDVVTWVRDEAAAQWGGVAALAREIDRLVVSLRDECDDLAAVSSRMAPMVARFPVGAAFARHADNHCASGRGPHCDGRLLTAVYYMSSDEWDAKEDGGCLRLYRPCATDAAAAGDGGGGDELGDEPSDELADVAPLADRLLLFFSDLRAPHEVLPVVRDGGMRAACTLWYCGGPKGADGTAADGASLLPAASVALPRAA